MSWPSLPAALKVALPLALGGVLAAAIALGAAGGNGGAPQPQAAAATATPRAETTRERVLSPTSTPAPFVYPNYIAPDAAALLSASQQEAVTRQSGKRCPDAYVLYESRLLGGSFCYPSSWKVARGDIGLPPKNQRGEGYRFSLLVTKADTSTGREVARVSIQIVGDRPFTLLDCPQKGILTVAALTSSACFHERRTSGANDIQPGIARLVGLEIPHALPEAQAVWVGIQLADHATSYNSVQLSAQDQSEALGIVASIRFSP
jgi:hypothetical protein